MAYTALQLITRAYYLSGIVSRGLQTPTGDQIFDGLYLLNSLLAIKTANNRLIPYYKLLTFSGIQGVEVYYIPTLINIESVTFNIGPIRYSMLEVDRVTYFGSPRIDNLNALPYQYYLERTLGGANLYIYFLPAGNYPLNVYGKFSLTAVSLNQDLSLTLDAYYIEYLRYALSEYMCADYNITLQPQVQQKLNEYEQLITDISPIDLTIQKLSTLQQDNSINYGDVNIGKGWRP